MELSDEKKREVYEALGNAYAKALVAARETGLVREVLDLYADIPLAFELKLELNIGILEDDTETPSQVEAVTTVGDPDWIKRMGIKLDDQPDGKKS
jgi:hypothetical protein